MDKTPTIEEMKKQHLEFAEGITVMLNHKYKMLLEASKKRKENPNDPILVIVKDKIFDDYKSTLKILSELLKKHQRHDDY